MIYVLRDILIILYTTDSFCWLCYIFVHFLMGVPRTSHQIDGLYSEDAVLWLRSLKVSW